MFCLYRFLYFFNFIKILFTSSINLFPGIASLIVNFWVLSFKAFKASTCFFFLFFSCFYLFFKCFTEWKICKRRLFYNST